jgi:hypothetical protein
LFKKGKCPGDIMHQGFKMAVVALVAVVAGFAGTAQAWTSPDGKVFGNHRYGRDNVTGVTQFVTGLTTTDGTMIRLASAGYQVDGGTDVHIFHNFTGLRAVSPQEGVLDWSHGVSHVSGLYRFDTLDVAGDILARAIAVVEVTGTAPAFTVVNSSDVYSEYYSTWYGTNVISYQTSWDLRFGTPADAAQFSDELQRVSMVLPEPAALGTVASAGVIALRRRARAQRA